jgi:hypothetical protein
MKERARRLVFLDCTTCMRAHVGGAVRRRGLAG